MSCFLPLTPSPSEAAAEACEVTKPVAQDGKLRREHNCQRALCRQISQLRHGQHTRVLHVQGDGPMKMQGLGKQAALRLTPLHWPATVAAGPTSSSMAGATRTRGPVSATRPSAADTRATISSLPVSGRSPKPSCSTPCKISCCVMPPAGVQEGSGYTGKLHRPDHAHCSGTGLACDLTGLTKDDPCAPAQVSFT